MSEKKCYACEQNKAKMGLIFLGKARDVCNGCGQYLSELVAQPKSEAELEIERYCNSKAPTGKTAQVYDFQAKQKEKAVKR